jgi:hypothetical protein
MAIEIKSTQLVGMALPRFIAIRNFILVIITLLGKFYRFPFSPWFKLLFFCWNYISSYYLYFVAMDWVS